MNDNKVITRVKLNSTAVTQGANHVLHLFKKLRRVTSEALVNLTGDSGREFGSPAPCIMHQMLSTTLQGPQK